MCGGLVWRVDAWQQAGVGKSAIPVLEAQEAQGVDSGPLAWGCSGRQSHTLRGPG